MTIAEATTARELYKKWAFPDESSEIERPDINNSGSDYFNALFNIPAEPINCHKCGKEYGLFDYQERCKIKRLDIPYGSRFDGDSVEIELCQDCMDEVLMWLVPQLKDHSGIQLSALADGCSENGCDGCGGC